MAEVFDFDKKENFTGLLSRKWEFSKALTGREDLLPLWIADMDFQTVPEVTDALIKRAQAGIFGYAGVTAGYTEAVQAWFKKRHGWQIEPAEIVQVTGVVTALHAALHAFSDEGDCILLQTPVYHPFFRTVKETKRRIVENPLIRTADGYAIDFADFAAKLEKYQPKIFILCNPQNPTGRVYTKDELQKLGEACLKHNTLVVADEIHSDIILGEKKHVPFMTISDALADNAIACTAPSKTFNLAGLKNSNIIIKNATLRQKFKETLAYLGLPQPNLFPLVAGEAAYKYGEAWLDAVLNYIRDNRDYALGEIKKRLPDVWAAKPDGTYFLWLDFSKYGFDKESLEKFMLDEAKLWFNQGYIFGKLGEGFVRVNIACRRALLEDAIARLEGALQKRQKG